MYTLYKLFLQVARAVRLQPDRMIIYGLDTQIFVFVDCENLTNTKNVIAIQKYVLKASSSKQKLCNVSRPSEIECYLSNTVAKPVQHLLMQMQTFLRL